MKYSGSLRDSRNDFCEPSQQIGMAGKETITYELQDLWHLDLCEDAAALVLSEIRGIANRKRIWALDGYFPWFTVVQFGHPLYLGEGNKVAIFEAVACFVQASYNTLFVLKAIQY